jgi:inward rectifier potassium channel
LNNQNQNNKDEEVQNLGLSNKDLTRGERLLNHDGSFNSRRVGLPFWETFNFFHYLIRISWPKFILIVAVGYVLTNILFGLLYYLIGVENNLLGVIAKNEGEKFLEAFYFSAQTFTTLGYGRISPVGVYDSTIAAFESLAGLLALALATGVLYGRFSRPVAKVLYSKKAIIAPFKDITGFQFRIANKNRSEIIDAEVRVMFTVLEVLNGAPFRKFYDLKLEYNKINFFSLIWTVNHPIDKESPMYGLTEEDLHKGQAEFIILLQGFDDTFSQNIHSRSSYRYNEIIWGAKFANIYGFDEDRRTTASLDRISEIEKV